MAQNPPWLADSRSAAGTVTAHGGLEASILGADGQGDDLGCELADRCVRV
eukprot:CAMPEP_0168358694 /NCGR_PEP_ID=MMETSP0228-20121227/1252_1 /TAXON_ID=133427 /ORGANISM="Protoceratium reticulatum, Strain CCCM 535 (=CCMP 1889)" /LENGTH=49 /DNA_ID=CAMNT_0008371287 /DNA_START=13 /DNA_END=162 /DNA_ORIENTATION=+